MSWCPTGLYTLYAAFVAFYDTNTHYSYIRITSSSSKPMLLLCTSLHVNVFAWSW